MTATLIATMPPADSIEMSEAELFFYADAKLYHEDDFEAQITAFARAGAERLGFLAGVIFEWETRWIEGIEVEHVTGTLAGEVLHEADYFAEFNDDDRRTVEADLINDFMLDRLLVAVSES